MYTYNRRRSFPPKSHPNGFIKPGTEIKIPNDCIHSFDMLLEAGSDVNAQDHNGDTALHVLVGKAMRSRQRRLPPHERTHFLDLDNQVGSAVKLLLHYGARVDIRNGEGKGVLDMAAEVENGELMEALLGHGV